MMRAFVNEVMLAEEPGGVYNVSLTQDFQGKMNQFFFLDDKPYTNVNSNSITTLTFEHLLNDFDISLHENSNKSFPLW